MSTYTDPPLTQCPVAGCRGLCVYGNCVSMDHYRIETREQATNARWRSDGIGDATGWPSAEAAREALAALGGLAVDDVSWSRDYRIVDGQTGEEVARYYLDPFGALHAGQPVLMRKGNRAG